ncbi:MAG: hypothetical protein OSB62_04660 [Alphaproteobacteria bacterium]|nr:hypothetical protein [Alphaproteobacteria bacterium]
MQRKSNPINAVLKNIPMHAIAVLAFVVLLSLFGLIIAFLAVATAYSFWMNLYAYWRIVGYETSPTTWRSDPKGGYFMITALLTVASCAALPFGVSALMGTSLLFIVVTWLLVNLFTAFYAFEWNKTFETGESD